MRTPHTMRAFDADLGYLAARIAEMGGLAERQIAQAVDALVNGDVALARAVIDNDQLLDTAKREVDERAILTIARRQPMAQDLREIIAVMRISTDLERIGDLGKNIAKRAIVLADAGRLPQVNRGIEAMGELVLVQLKDVLDAFASRKDSALESMRDNDRKIDAIHTSLFREVLTYMMEDPRNIAACTHLLFCAKNLERAGDHATNIAEYVHMMITGRTLPADRAKSDLSHTIGAEVR